jgi:hypothetical protein
MVVNISEPRISDYLGTLAVNMRLAAESIEQLRESIANTYYAGLSRDLLPSEIVRLESDVVAMRNRVEGYLKSVEIDLNY